MTKDLEALYQEAKTALAAREYDRAAELLRQILLEDHDYKDVSGLLAQTIKLKRRRWYNDPRVWSVAGMLVVAALLVWLAPRFSIADSALAEQSTASATMIQKPTATQVPTASQVPTATTIPSPTPVPLVWKRLSIGLEFPKDTVTAIAVDPNDPDVIYVGMQAAGVYKSIDGGVSWKPVLQGLGNSYVDSLLLDPEDPEILYAGTEGGVFRTINGGKNWNWVGDGSHLLMDPQDSSHLYARIWGSVFETGDQGKTWNEVFQGSCPGFWDWVIHPSDGAILYTITLFDLGECRRGVYKSKDGGRTWNLLGVEDQNVYSIAVAKSNQGNVSIYVHGDGGDYRSVDDGANWVFQNSVCTFLTADMNAPDTAYCSTGAGLVILKPDQASRSIYALNNVNVTSFHIDNYNNSTRMIAGGQGLYISTDAGVTWTEQSSGLGIVHAEIKIDPLNSLRSYLAVYLGEDEQECNLYRSDDGGKNWKLINKGGHISWCGPVFDTNNDLYALIEDRMAKSKNAGDSWSYQRISNTLESGLYGKVAANPYLPGNFYAIAIDLFYSVDNASTWQKAEKISGDPYTPFGRLYYADGGQLMYSVGGMFYSTDAGQTWNSCRDANASSSDTQMAIDPRDGKHLFLASSGNGIMISQNGCTSWQESNTGLGNLYVNSVAIDPNAPDTIYAGTNGGAYISFDGGVGWNEINEGLLGTTVIYSIAIDNDSNVFAATPYGIFQLEEE